MNARQRELLDRCFAETLLSPPELRIAWLDEHCDDAEVRAEVESLLAFTTGPPPGDVNNAIRQTAASLIEAELTGQRVGHYRLTGRIAEGGMGAVYRAVRADGDFDQTVAIKMLRFAYSEPGELQRFRRERQILATLEHPHIARLLDGGAWILPGNTVSQPYIVMEYVEGLPLTTYCDSQRLNVRQRLVLFRQACEALTYAHQRLVVHRDIKPGNILVDKNGVLKLLDFGIAKLLDRDGETAAITGPVAMTPDYASPEQVRGEAVSALTDVYSLGAVLFELLAGRRAHQFASYDPIEIAREICEHDVPPPSAWGRRNLRRDLDVIVLKAMQTEPARRYNSVEQFSEDIQRYLDGHPILARPDTLVYRTTRFVQRHRLGLAGIAAVLATLTVGVVMNTRQAIRATRAEKAALLERDRADAEAATAKAVNEFLQKDLLAQAGASAQSQPGNKPDPDLKVRTALDRAAARIGQKFRGQPRVEASIRHTISQTYEDLGLFSEAQPHLERAIELRKRELGEENPVTLSTRNNLGELYWRQGKYPEAEKLLTALLKNQRRVLGERHPDTIKTMDDLGTVYDEQGKSAESEALYTEALDARRKALGEEHQETLNTMNNLAVVYKDQGRLAEAEGIFSRVWEIQRRILGEEHPDALSTMTNLGGVYALEKKFSLSEPLLMKAVKIKQRVLGAEHPDTLLAMTSLASVSRMEGKYEQAESLFDTLVGVQRRVLGEEHPAALATMNSLATLYVYQGKYAQAEPLFARLLAGMRHVRGEEHPDTLSSLNNQALLYRAEGKFSRAEQQFLTVLAARRRVLGEEHPDTLRTMGSLAIVCLAEGEISRAEALLTKVLAVRRERDEVDPDRLMFLGSLGEVRFRQRKYGDAEALLRTARDGYQKTNADTWPRYYYQCVLGTILAEQGKHSEAEPLLLSGYQSMLRIVNTTPVEDRSSLGRVREWIVRLYQHWGVPAKAAEWLELLRSGQATTAAQKP
jgi:serine/threonine protein kinase/tetratricopeptide (TPR) repeat protein